MTATVTTTATAAPAPPAAETPTPKRRRRRHRVVIPFSVLFLLVAGTIVLHALNEPDRTDLSFLSPGSTAPLGSSKLADRLRANGITVERQTSTSDALVSAYKGDATLFVPAPELMPTGYLTMLSLLPTGTRVVLVEPGTDELNRADAPVVASGRRWASAVMDRDDDTAGGCEIDLVDRAGPAAALRTAYAPGADVTDFRSCYGGGLASVGWQSTELTVAGSVDPFRNDRIDEVDNSAFAVGLLSGHSRVVWLDVHRREAGPQVDPNASAGEGVPPSLAPGGDGTGTGDGGGSGQGDGGSGSNGGGGSGGSDDDQASGADQPPIWTLFPAGLWATLTGLLLLGLLLALWRGRRLGPPVAEPIPFAVKGAETVLGRARLYRRAGAVLTGSQTLRRETGPRIAAALGLPPTADADTLARAIAARHGGDPAEYLAVLADDLPKKDAELVELARALDSLLTLVSTPTYDPERGDTRG
ncbi:DUF4350 domain-containing protein [Hamadaea tsunoensis]|uniref:DUF4350 domain-containing protein n=1 Tax=Hamadaea tsunoensis TaxID=53368 RepID=UPI000402BF4D|nr:DUF4350 domain-containing protein [Hamadaea tsunoensis]